MKLIILDRDGVINQDRDDFVKSVDEWIPIEGSMDANRLFNAGRLHHRRGHQPIRYWPQILYRARPDRNARKMHRLAVQAGGTIDGIWFCPHTAADNCECRKPKPGMIIDIIERFKANAAETWLVGDSLRDLQAIEAAGGKSALVLTGKGKKTLAKHEQDLPEHTQVFDNLLAFSQYIMRENTQIEETAQAIL